MSKEIDKDEKEKVNETFIDNDWISVLLMLLIFGYGSNSKDAEIDKRLSILEAKSDIYEKLLTKK